MPCPTCDHTLNKLCTSADGVDHWHCPRCGTHRMMRDGWHHDTVPKAVECVRSFVRMISPGQAGRWLRGQAELSGVLESVHQPGDRPKGE